MTNRILIIGPPGSGKTTVAVQLAKELDLPLHHLDRSLFMPGGIKRDYQEFIQMQQEMMKSDKWIIEGCGLRSLKVRYAKTELVIKMEIPKLLCIWRTFKRFLFERNFHPDTPEGCSKIFNLELIRYIWNFENKQAPIMQECQKLYPKVKVISIKSSSQIKNLEAKLQSTCT